MLCIILKSSVIMGNPGYFRDILVSIWQADKKYIKGDNMKDVG